MLLYLSERATIRTMTFKKGLLIAILLFLGYRSYVYIEKKEQSKLWAEEERRKEKAVEDSLAQFSRRAQQEWLALPVAVRDSITKHRKDSMQVVLDSLKEARPLGFVKIKDVSDYKDYGQTKPQHRVKFLVANESKLSVNSLTIQITPLKAGGRTNSYPETIDTVIRPGDNMMLDIPVVYSRVDVMNKTVMDVDVQLRGAKFGSREFYYPELRAPDGYIVKVSDRRR